MVTISDHVGFVFFLHETRLPKAYSTFFDLIKEFLLSLNSLEVYKQFKKIHILLFFYFFRMCHGKSLFEFLVDALLFIFE